MNLNDLLNQVADDADVGFMADPSVIRQTGERRSARSRRHAAIGVAAAVLIAFAGTVLLTRVGENRVEPAPSLPEQPDRVTYMTADGISFVAEDGSRQTLHAKNVDRYAFSPDGQQVAYITYNNSNRLWLADADGAQPDRRPSPCAGCMPGYGLTWSHIGARLAYSVFTPGKHRPAQLRIWTVGTGDEQIIRMPRGCDARGPRFSPDDQSLAMNLSCEHGEYAAGDYVATVDPDLGASSLTPLTHRYSQVQLPSWSADGRTIYFTATTSGDNTNTTSGTGDLFAVGAVGTGLRKITDADPGERYFSASAYRGSFLISRAYRKGPWTIGVLSGDGGTFTPMTGPDGKPVLGDQPQLQP